MPLVRASAANPPAAPSLTGPEKRASIGLSGAIQPQIMVFFARHYEHNLISQSRNHYWGGVMFVRRFIYQMAFSVLFIISVLAPSSANAVPFSALPDFSPLIPYTALGNDVFLNLATVNGNVGVSKNGTFTMSAPSFINGRLDLDSGVTTSIADPTHISGGVHTGVDLSVPQALVFSASNTLKNLAADFTLGNVNTAQTFAGNGAVTVIDMNSLTLGGSNNITFTGGPNDIFVLNIAHGLALTGSSIIGAGGIDPSHILVNLYDTSGNLGTAAHIGNVINGSVLVPFDTATFHSMNGATWSGDALVTFMSGATITSVPFVPEPSTIALIIVAGAMGALYRAKRHFR
jgi:hypothetical protein